MPGPDDAGPVADGGSVQDGDVPLHPLGRVGKPHGLDGAFVVTRPRADLLTRGSTVIVAGVEREIVHRGGTDQRPVLRLEGVEGITAAQALRGSDLLVPRDRLPDLEDDEFWPDDLVGLPVRATGGQPVGTVAEVLVLPSCDVLRVERPEAGDLLVPLHREAVPVLDVPGRDVRVDLAFMDEPLPDDPGAGEA